MKSLIKPIIIGLGLLWNLPSYAAPATTTTPIKKAAPVHQVSTNHINGPSNLPETGTKYLPIDLDTPGQSFVSTGPYLGVPLQYSGSNLIINNPNINEDVSLLNLRKNINKRLAQMGGPHCVDHAHLLLSGQIEAQAFYKKGGPGSNSSDINVTTVNLDSYILGPSSWTSGLMSFSYEDDIGSEAGVIATTHRVSNSRLFVNKAFIIVGDFAQSPFYGTIGQMYVPFGTYSTSFVTSPMTKTLFRTKDRALLVGYQGQTPCTFYGSIYAFRGDAKIPSNSKRINNGGINVGYRAKKEGSGMDIGAGVLANIADSFGLQRTLNGPGVWGGFGAGAYNACGPGGTGPCGSESIVHRVPAYEMRAMFDIGEHWDLLAEYIFASTAFNPNDATFKSIGAKPQALNAEIAYSFCAFNRPNSIAVGYGMTKEALMLGLPAQRWGVVWNTSIWRDTLESLEFRHDRDYAGSATSSGNNIPGPTPSGLSDNVLTAQFDIYF